MRYKTSGQSPNICYKYELEFKTNIDSTYHNCFNPELCLYKTHLVNDERNNEEQ